MQGLKALFYAGLCVCFFAPNTLAQDATNRDTVLAQVNGTEITLGHVLSITQSLPEQYDNVPAQDLLSGILDRLIQQTLLAQNADTNQARIRIANENNERNLRANDYLEKLTITAAGDAALQSAYQDYISAAVPEPQFRASHILLDSEEAANDVVAMLDSGQDFAQVAVEHSTGPSGPNGGDLGWFGLGQMVPEFEQGVMQLAVGQVSAPVQTQFGWHVIKLFDKREFPPFEELSQTLAEGLRATAVENKLAELESSSEIVRAPLDFDPELVREFSLLDQ